MRSKELNWYGHVRGMSEERLAEKNWNGVRLEKEKRITSKYVDTESSN